MRRHEQTHGAPSLSALGLDEDEELEPPISGAQQVEHCWHFLGGWYPERLPIFLALNDVDDVDHLVAGLMALRDGPIKE